jgi:hypothetical protein
VCFLDLAGNGNRRQHGNNRQNNRPHLVLLFLSF